VTRTSLSCALVAGAILLVAAPARAQYRFDFWTTDSGLPQNSVRSILQTRDGYLWFTTFDGVVRYDGVRFRVFDRATTAGIGSNRFFALVEEPDGALWMATEDGGVTRLLRGRFTTYSTSDGLPDPVVRAIELDSKDRLLVNTRAGLARWDGQRFVRIGDPWIGPIYRDRSGALWHQVDKRVERLKDGVASVVQLPLGETLVTAFCEDKKNAVWISTTDCRLYVVKDGSVAEPVDVGDSGCVTTMREDGEGNLWLGTSAKGLIRLKDGRRSFYGPQQGLSDNNVISIFEDREGSIWVGTGNRGINRLGKQAITVLTTNDGLKSEHVYPIYEDPHGTIWVGGGGLCRWVNGRFTVYGRKDGLPYDLPMALFEDSEGRLWIGASGGLAYRKDERFFDFSDKLGLQVGNYNVWAIHEDPHHALWFGTDHGLVKYFAGQSRIYTVRDGLADDDVKAIHETRDGKLWFGTYGGLSYLEGERFRSLTEADGLASNRVRVIHEDEDGTLWIGTYDGGLSRFRDGRFINYTTQQGLFNNGVFQILDDLHGNYWMSCNRGIYRVSKEELNAYAEGKVRSITSVSYGTADGLLNTECNGGRQPSGIRDRNGRLWIPTQSGIAVIDAANLTANPSPPPVVVEEVLVDRELVSAGEGLRIGAGKENLEIHYNGLSFVKPEQVQFKYRMEGLDREWIDAGTRRVAYYPYLPPGSYTFAVKAANSDGVWSVGEKRISITVLPPFWRTGWFTALMVLSVAGAAFLIYRRRVSALERTQAAQEAFSRQLIDSQESERKRIAAELHDSLGQNLLVIKNWAVLGLSKLAEGNPSREELGEISTAASQAISEVREISYDLRPHLLDEVGLAEAIRSMGKRVASSSRIAFEFEIDPVDNLLSKQGEIGAYRIVQEAVNNIVRHSAATHAAVILRRDLNGVLIQIRDNGKGLTETGDSTRKGFGLLGMSERARMLGGKFTAESAPGRGTTIEVRLAAENSSK